MPVPPPNSYAPGTKLTVGSHQVQIIKYISEGGFAYVYTCTIDPPFHGSNVACLKRVAVPNKWQLSLLRQEVDAMRRLRGNKHIVSYIDSHASRLGSATNGEQQYEVFLLMEYCENNGLIGFMNTRLTNKLTEPEVLTIMYEVTIAVAMCHHLEPPLIHRDIKIENILIDSKGTYKLCDFGSSVPYIPAPKTPQELQTTRDDIMNHTTPQYRAPEMIDLTKGFALDDKLDIWALGCFLYKLCYYTTPFELPNQKSMQDLEQAILGCSHTLRFHDQPGLMFSPRLKNVIKCCLREDPRRRPNAVQLLGEICQMKGVQVPSVIPYSVKHSKHPEALVNADIKLAKPNDPSSKRYLKDNKPADPFSTIDKLKFLKSATVNLPTVGKPPSKPLPPPKVEDEKHLNIQNYVQQALNRSSEDLGPRVEDDRNGTLDFLRSKETDSQSRQDTGGSFKALKNNLRRISTGNSGAETASQGHNTARNRSSISSIKQILTGNSYRKSSSPEEQTPQDPPPEQPKRLSIQKRMHLLMNSKDEQTRSAKGYGRYTDVKDLDEINAINKTQSALSSDEEHYIHRDRLKKGPPKVPDSLSSHRLAKSTSPAPQPRPRSVGAGPRAKTEELPPLPARKIPPKPAKPKHLKARSDRFDSRRASVSSEFSVPDIDDLEQEFSKRYPSYV